MSSTPAFSADQLLKHSGWARSLARQLVADAATAEDVVQETWIAALREQPSTDRPLRPWLERVIRNFAANSRRNRKTRARHEQAAGDGDSMAASVADVVAKAEGQQRVVAAVLALSEPYRSVVLLRYYEGLSAAEIARRSDTPAGTVRWQVSAGLQLLREKLDAEENGDRRAWCTALLPLAGFQSVQEVAAAGSVSSLTADRARSSFMTILKGAVVMKSAWMVGVAAVSAVVLFWMLQDGGGPPVLTPVSDNPSVAAASAEIPEQTHVRSEAPVALVEEVDDVIAEPLWRASVKVRFVDRYGVGVAGVRARFSRDAEFSSDDEGRIELSVPKPYDNIKSHRGPLSLVARHDEFATVHRSVVTATLMGNGDVVELGVIELEAGGSITGHVVDTLGAAIVGARISVEGRSSGSPRASSLLTMVSSAGDRVGKSSAKTDASGNFRIDGVLPGANKVMGSLRAGAARVDEVSGEVSVDVVAGSEMHVELTLKSRFEPEQIVTIIVEDPDGKPLPNARVSVKSNYGNSATSTNEQGRVRCGFLRGGPEVDVTVIAPNGQYATVVHEGAFLGQSVTIRFARSVPMPLHLVSEAGRVIAKARVRLHTVASGGFLGFGRKRAVDLVFGEFEVAADGSVAGVHLPKDRFMIEVHTRGHEVQSFGPYEPAVAKAGVKLSLVASPMVAGRVVDADGKPVVGAVVELLRRPTSQMIYNGFPVWLDPHGMDRSETDADGAFELTARGKQSFFVRADSNGFAATMTTEMTGEDFARGGKQLRLELNQGGSIQGYVLRADGRSTGGTIVVANRGDGFAVTTRVAADGRYEFEQVTPGKYQVQRTGSDLSPGGSSSRNSLGRPIQQLSEPNCTVVVGEVTRCDLGARYVYDAKLIAHIDIPGWSLAGKRVAIEFADVKEGQHSTEQWHARVGDDGRFEVPLLPSGALRLRIADGRRMIEAKLNMLPGENRFKLAVEAKMATLRDLPTVGPSGEATMVIASWTEGTTTIHLPVEVGADGTATVSLPKGKVSLERMPTASDLSAIMLAGGLTMIPFREIIVQ
ncbi:MAG: RNA polymerase sigma-70 factor (ECF subfamily) [Planctomycetota bacterium]|jgi:RNA polymerase sigma-70 factor (ECF subfamily)